MGNILFVDDEASILSAVKRVFSLLNHEILTAQRGEEALQLFKRYPISVLVTDQRMPLMTGTELVERVRQLFPDTVRVIITAFPDLASLLEAVSNGKIFRFIVKPWSDDELVESVDAALEQYQQNLKHRKQEGQEEQVLLALAQRIELNDHYTLGHCENVARYAVGISRALGLPEDQVKDIRTGAWLHDCGKIDIPEEILNYPGRIDDQQMVGVKKHQDKGAKFAEQADLPQRVVNVIRFHHERVDGRGYPLGLSRESIPLEAKIVAVADVYDALTSDRPYRKAFAAKQVEQIMLGSRGCDMDAELVEIFMTRTLPQLQYGSRIREMIGRMA